jgi:predicted permease
MSAVAFFRSLINSLLRRGHADREIDSELHSHIQHRADDLENSGLPRAEAERRARVEFGGYERFKDESHAAAGGHLISAVLQDVRFGLRLWRKSPGFSLTAVLLLGLGIGVTTAVFSLVDTVLLKPLPYPDADRLVIPWCVPPPGRNFGGYGKFGWVPTQFHAMQEQTKTYQYLGAFEGASFNLTGVGEPSLVEGLRVSWGFFPALGTSPSIGRIFTPDEDQPGRDHEVILSDALWRQYFHADSQVIGRSIDLNGSPYSVVGVMPSGFAFPRANEMPGSMNFSREAQLWIPAALPPVSPRFTPSELAVVGRLQPDVSVAQAQAAMDLFSAQMDRLNPQFKGSYNSLVTPLKQQVAGDLKRPLLLLLLAVGAVLLIVCFNMASLLLTRSITRQHEFTLRAALGAGRRRILRQLLTESLMLAAAGSFLGLGFATAAIWATKTFGPSTIPRLQEAAPDLRVFAFVLVATLLTGIFIGFTPALSAIRINLVESLKSGGQKAGTGNNQSRLRNTLVVFQITLALVLVIASGLLIRSFYYLLNSDGGFRSEHVLTFELSLPTAKYPDREHIARFYQQAIPQLRGVPGVQSVAITDAMPMAGSPEGTAIRVPGQPPVSVLTQSPMVDYAIVSPDFFATLKTPFERGRDFLNSDDESQPAVTIVNRTMARQLWPQENALGKQVVVPAQPRPMIVVGIVANIKYSSLHDNPAPQMFVPYTQNAWPSMSIMQVVLRTQADPDAVIGGARRALHSLDPGVPLAKITTLAELTDTSLLQQRFSMMLLGFFGVFSLLLAAVGIYGVISYSVSQQTREIGIRMALGAERNHVFRTVLKNALRLAAAGIGFGLIVAFVVAHILTSYIFGVKAYDPLTFVTVSSILAIVSLCAGFFPARRAASIDPMRALRAE